MRERLEALVGRVPRCNPGPELERGLADARVVPGHSTRPAIASNCLIMVSRSLLGISAFQTRSVMRCPPCVWHEDTAAPQNVTALGSSSQHLDHVAFEHHVIASDALSVESGRRTPDAGARGISYQVRVDSLGDVEHG